MKDTILKTELLSKNYGKIKALDSLSLEVKKGTIFGILGPNGSGKTTTLGILLGVLNASSGTYSWFNNGTTDANRKRIGALLETPNFYPYLTAVQNLQIVGKIKGVDQISERIDRVLKEVQLSDRKDYEFRTYSLGMKQRLAIASALLSDPEVLVLDEPTNGLDPQGIAEIRTLILSIAKEGKTILIASHQLDEIEKICTDVLILRKGQTLRIGSIHTLVENSRQLKVSAVDMPALIAQIEKLSKIAIVKTLPDSLLIEVPEELTSTAVNRLFFDAGIVLSGLTEIKKSLEDQFLEIIKT